MSDDTQQPIVVKKIKKGGGAAHGGAWKIAYADFVTAMMAFFLLMWLLGSTSQGDLKGIAEFFQNPLKVSMGGGSGSGDSSSVITGGGRDLTSTHGQVKKGTIEAEKKTLNLQRLKADYERAEKTRLETLKGELEKLIEASPALSQFKNQLLLDITTEGLRIQIMDDKNRPMFDSASSDVKPYTRVILREIGLALNKVENRISLSGHTDAQPYAGGDRGFGNWELSTNRANASRREMVAGGMDDAKIMRVVGLASTVLYDKVDTYNPQNRRINIIVLNKRTEEAILADGRQEDAEAGQDANAPGINVPAATGR
ncbi:flagellar motor protein MotB [Sulfuritalea hydrogenivorans]|uniref:Flagellar motor protein MotB n=1 Tax=Sulfuritalea hydrogenivorans sk43H TaxID=1223802 RepID=W0SCN8_9PROT|nr:flagellar motor protein MotB [Sulfuritalea hydrogenivorans]MDK9715082.1 flagellar motor protein MotB [Sulfuritalea sp.]BAO28697.1 flagellar motor protein MotB [Sulfuritalea hydrogenivorans sk43H]